MAEAEKGGCLISGGLIAAWALVALLGGCSDKGLDSRAAGTVRGFGFEPQKVEGYGWLRCGVGDLFNTRFEATNAQGQRVKGTVCRGMFKGSTIRLD